MSIPTSFPPTPPPLPECLDEEPRTALFGARFLPSIPLQVTFERIESMCAPSFCRTLPLPPLFICFPLSARGIERFPFGKCSPLLLPLTVRRLSGYEIRTPLEAIRLKTLLFSPFFLLGFPLPPSAPFDRSAKIECFDERLKYLPTTLFPRLLSPRIRGLANKRRGSGGPCFLHMRIWGYNLFYPCPLSLAAASISRRKKQRS